MVPIAILQTGSDNRSDSGWRRSAVAGSLDLHVLMDAPQYQRVGSGGPGKARQHWQIVAGTVEADDDAVAGEDSLSDFDHTLAPVPVT